MIVLSLTRQVLETYGNDVLQIKQSALVRGNSGAPCPANATKGCSANLTLLV